MTGEAPHRSLAGKTVVLTRPREQSGELESRLSALGARVLLCPLIRIEPVAAGAELDAALRKASGYDWIAVTSANAARLLVEGLRRVDVDLSVFSRGAGPSLRSPRARRGGTERGTGRMTQIGEVPGDGGASSTLPVRSAPRLAAVGRGTGAVLERGGLEVALVAGESTAAALAAEMVSTGVERARVLFPCARGAREDLPELLERAGATVERLVLYDTVADADSGRTLRAEMGAHRLDVVAFASPSAVQQFHDLVARAEETTAQLACIGPVTAGRARELGFPVAAVAADHGLEGLVDAIVRAAGEKTRDTRLISAREARRTPNGSRPK